MKGIIIAGGLGTRLRPLTLARPKHMLPVANRPFLEYQVALLKRHGIREIVFASNYLWEQIQAHFGDGADFGVSMEYALEPEPLGTAGAIRNAVPLTADECVMVLNGDVLTDFDLSEIVRFHEKRDAEATIALRAVNRPHAFGVLRTESDGRVREWHEPTEEEKKRVSAAGDDQTGESDFINAGIYVLEPEFVARIPTGRPVSIERETYPGAIGDGMGVYAMAPEGYWLDIGSPRQYLAANYAVLAGQVKTDVQFDGISESAEISETTAVDQLSAIGADSTVGAGSRIQRSVLLETVRIGRNVVVNGAVLDSGVVVEDDCVIGEGAVIESGRRMAKGSRL